MNQLVGLTTAAGLVLMCVSAVVLWWRRRESGVLGAPPVAARRRGVSFGLIALVVLLGLYLPMMGISLIVVLLAEDFVLRRIPATQRWLGLQPVG